MSSSPAALVAVNGKRPLGVLLLIGCAVPGLACAPGRLVTVSYGQSVREYEVPTLVDSQMQVIECGYAPGFLHPVYGVIFGIGDEDMMSVQAYASYDLGFYFFNMPSGDPEDGHRRVWPLLRTKVGIEWDSAQDRGLHAGIGGAVGLTLSLGGEDIDFPPNMLSIEYGSYVDTNGDRTTGWAVHFYYPLDRNSEWSGSWYTP
jgi:hypothetical protein